MRKAVTDGTVYDDLDAWAKSQGMDADAAIEAAVPPTTVLPNLHRAIDNLG
jgi:hypothetical protein